ncbi:uncharacterized protein LOC124775689 [Schistocerca piceifrons]|uniref:uncharacterized protein LOC124775689 n=1 Tax=Schistocerca piceifrons TaxID=274613 RepID=UPI001F5F3ED7|nr:uncharacterized protein LOC124775689 [Schistocerca piceifrons]
MVAVNLTALVNGTPLIFEVDIGTSATIVDGDSNHQLGSPPLRLFTNSLKSYNNDIIQLQELFSAPIQYLTRDIMAQILVLTASKATNVLETELLHPLGLKLHDSAPGIKTLPSDTQLQELLESFSDIVPDISPGVSGFKAHTELLPLVVPRLIQAHTVTFAIHDN